MKKQNKLQVALFGLSMLVAVPVLSMEDGQIAAERQAEKSRQFRAGLLGAAGVGATMAAKKGLYPSLETLQSIPSSIYSGAQSLYQSAPSYWQGLREGASSLYNRLPEASSLPVVGRYFAPEVSTPYVRSLADAAALEAGFTPSAEVSVPSLDFASMSPSDYESFISPMPTAARSAEAIADLAAAYAPQVAAEYAPRFSPEDLAAMGEAFAPSVAPVAPASTWGQSLSDLYGRGTSYLSDLYGRAPSLGLGSVGGYLGGIPSNLASYIATTRAYPYMSDYVSPETAAKAALALGALGVIGTGIGGYKWWQARKARAAEQVLAAEQAAQEQAAQEQAAQKQANIARINLSMGRLSREAAIPALAEEAELARQARSYGFGQFASEPITKARSLVEKAKARAIELELPSIEETVRKSMQK